LKSGECIPARFRSVMPRRKRIYEVKNQNKNVLIFRKNQAIYLLLGKIFNMRVVIQRVSEATVTVAGKLISGIAAGMVVLVGFEEADEAEDIEWMVKKICQLRIFNDDNGIMNLSVAETGGEIIVVSQFTLHASTKKGNRPSYIRAARPEKAIPLYEEFIVSMENMIGKPVGKGIFGAHMEISLVNDGPVTIIIDSKNKDL
jgi:D-aminoacyl-tRNA deacylase